MPSVWHKQTTNKQKHDNNGCHLTRPFLHLFVLIITTIPKVPSTYKARQENLDKVVMKRFLFKHTPIPNCLVHYFGQTVNFQIHPMMDNTTFVHIQTNSTYKFIKGQILNFRMCNQLVAYRTLLHIIFTP